MKTRTPITSATWLGIALACACVNAAAQPSPSAGERSVVPLASDQAASAITGGLPAMSGITPSRAELPGSAFAKLDARRRGYLTREDTVQLEGFEPAFRLADTNGDGRLDGDEFAAAWAAYSGLGK